MQLSVKATLTTTMFAASLHTAQAGTIDALNLLNDYNVIVSGDAAVNSHVDGNTLIGGNLASGGDYHIHNTPTTVPALTVGGNLTGNANVNGPGLNVGGNVGGSVNMNGGGSAYVGSVSGFLQNNANGSGSTYVVGDISGTVNTNGGNTVYGGNLTGYANANGGGTVQNQAVTMPFDPVNVATSAVATLNGFSAELTSIAANSIFNFSGNKVTFDAVADSNGLAAFTITDANDFFSKAGEFDFNLANGVQTVLINVVNSDIASALNINVNFLAGSAVGLGKKLLWNFQNASVININAQFGGSLLALDAAVTNGNNIEGTLVAASLLQNGEIHYQGTNADVGAFGTPTNTGTVPLPGTLSLFAIGVAGLGAFARRR